MLTLALTVNTHTQTRGRLCRFWTWPVWRRLCQSEAFALCHSVPVSGKIYSLMVSLAPPQCSKVPKRESKAALPQVAEEVCYSCSGTSSPQSCDRGGAHSCNTAVPRHGIRVLLGRIIFSCGTIGSFLGFSSPCNLAPACLWQWKTSSDTAKCPQPDKTKPSWEPLWNTVALGQVAALLKFSF